MKLKINSVKKRLTVDISSLIRADAINSIVFKYPYGKHTTVSNVANIKPINWAITYPIPNNISSLPVQIAAIVIAGLK
ncbi:hypothetical protein EBI_27081 [Enterocytozoon bieneusi H348]|nr:hypothetical protein EBI_27081 [Enterocytozoon bieneusi H348]|eukprot:XP_002649752.1 hypothetical protein EBI_27081 [Enterocytozoon bieneusi H348]